MYQSVMKIQKLTLHPRSKAAATQHRKVEKHSRSIRYGTISVTFTKQCWLVILQEKPAKLTVGQFVGRQTWRIRYCHEITDKKGIIFRKVL